MEKIAKEKIMAFYLILTLITTLIGFFLRKSGDGYEKLMYGFVAGLILSVILWVSWGKDNSY